jgi:hypothetical protein
VTAPLFSVANSPASSLGVSLGERRLRSPPRTAHTVLKQREPLVMDCPERIVEVAASLTCLLYSLRRSGYAASTEILSSRSQLETIPRETIVGDTSHHLAQSARSDLGDSIIADAT